MSFDPRSLERLRQLGRQLPQPLPKEDSRPEGSGRTGRKRHKVETEQNPQALFHELMKASADGTVPDHLMARLKQAEEKADEERRRLGPRANANADRSSPSAGDRNGGRLPAPPGRQVGKGKNTQPRRPDVTPGSEEESMYVAFGQLFLEDDEDAT